MYYITTPFYDNRVAVSFNKPDTEYLIVEKIPDGDGILIIEDGILKRQSYSVPDIKTPFETITKENEDLKTRVAQQESIIGTLLEEIIPTLVTIIK